MKKDLFLEYTRKSIETELKRQGKSKEDSINIDLERYQRNN